MRPALRHLAFKEKIATRGFVSPRGIKKGAGKLCTLALRTSLKSANFWSTIPILYWFLKSIQQVCVFFNPVKSCEVAALFCCLGLYSVGPLLRTSQVWPHSILGCLDLFRSPSQSQGGSQRPWSLSSFSRADVASKQIPESILRYVLKVFLYMQILIGTDVTLLWCPFLSVTEVCWWNSATRILKDVNQTIREAWTATCSCQKFWPWAVLL